MDSCLKIMDMINWKLTSVYGIDVARQHSLIRLKLAISNTDKTIFTEHLLLAADCLSAIEKFAALNGDPLLKGHKSLDISKMIRNFSQTGAGRGEGSHRAQLILP